MNSHKIKLFSLLLLAGLLFQGCTKDDELIEETTAALNGNNNGNNNSPHHGGNNPPSNGKDVRSLSNDLIEEWTDVLLSVERYAGGMRPNATARALAYIYLASYETAQPGMRGHRSNANRLQGLRINRNELPRNVDYRVALNTCFAEVMDHFLLNVPAAVNDQIDDLENEMEVRLTANLSDRLVEESQEWGAYVAGQIIEYSQTDTDAEAQILAPQPLSYEPPVGDGFWTYSAEQERALFPYWESVRTFVVDPSETTSLPPIPYSENPNSPYFEEMMEVYQINNTAKEEDNEQLWIAEFWSDDVEGITFSPPARQFSIANQLIDQYEMNLEEALTLYVKLGFSMNDAAVSTWKYKYEHMVMRPNVYIHEFIDADYQTNLFRLIPWPNPTFPGYPSGHSCFASAASGVFIDFFGNETNFTDISHEGRTEFRSTPRTFNSFEQLAEENAYSRIPLGVHIRMDCTEGLRLGYEISDGINDLELRSDPL